MRWGFLQEFSVGPELGEVEECEVGNLNGPQLGYVLQFSVGNFEMEPNLAIQTGQCSEIRMERSSGMIWGFSQKISVGPELREVEGWMVGKSEWKGAQA